MCNAENKLIDSHRFRFVSNHPTVLLHTCFFDHFIKIFVSSENFILIFPASSVVSPSLYLYIYYFLF
jgi:hypothetical protein